MSCAWTTLNRLMPPCSSMYSVSFRGISRGCTSLCTHHDGICSPEDGVSICRLPCDAIAAVSSVQEQSLAVVQQLSTSMLSSVCSCTSRMSSIAARPPATFPGHTDVTVISSPSGRSGLSVSLSFRSSTQLTTRSSAETVCHSCAPSHSST